VSHVKYIKEVKIHEKHYVFDFKEIKLPPEAIPAAAARASKKPTSIKGFCGKESISSVTVPA
jgi:hypothetical protein